MRMQERKGSHTSHEGMGSRMGVEEAAFGRRRQPAKHGKRAERKAAHSHSATGRCRHSPKGFSSSTSTLVSLPCQTLRHGESREMEESGHLRDHLRDCLHLKQG